MDYFGARSESQLWRLTMYGIVCGCRMGDIGELGNWVTGQSVTATRLTKRKEGCLHAFNLSFKYFSDWSVTGSCSEFYNSLGPRDWSYKLLLAYPSDFVLV